MKQAAFALALAQGGQQHPVRQDIVDTVRAHPAASWEPFDARSNPLALLSASETSQERAFVLLSASFKGTSGGNNLPREFDARVEYFTLK